MPPSPAGGGLPCVHTAAAVPGAHHSAAAVHHAQEGRWGGAPQGVRAAGTQAQRQSQAGWEGAADPCREVGPGRGGGRGRSHCPVAGGAHPGHRDGGSCRGGRICQHCRGPDRRPVCSTSMNNTLSFANKTINDKHHQTGTRTGGL